MSAGVIDTLVSRGKLGGMDVQSSGTTVCGISSDCMEGRASKKLQRASYLPFLFLFGHVLGYLCCTEHHFHTS